MMSSEKGMDLHDFEGQSLYFEEPLSDKVNHLLQRAASAYENGNAEHLLQRAYFHAPHSLTVLVALYRFYYYQHRMADTLKVADLAMRESGSRLGFPTDWRNLNMTRLGAGALRSMGLVRFYLLALKGAGYVNLRLGQCEEGMAMLEKIIELDANDRLGAQLLLSTAREHLVNLRRASLRVVG